MTSSVDTMCREARVIVICGTGGVGKTSIAAALGLEAARLGRRAVVITIDPALRLADAIGITASVGNEPQQVSADVSGELWVSMLDVQQTFGQLVRDTSPTPQVAAEVMNNSFYRTMSQSLSGTRDYMAAERLYSLSNDPRFDVVIVDTPPSRNALDFLESPERLARFLQHHIVRLLIAPSRGGFGIAGAAMQSVTKIISSVVGSDALSGAVSFLRAFEGMEDEFSRHALTVATTLRSDATHFVVVTAPFADALGEADHFVSELARLTIPLRLIVANRMPPTFGSTSAAQERELAATTFGDTALAHALLADMTHEAEEASAKVIEFISRTRTIFPNAATAQATEQAVDIHDMESIGTLADQLAVHLSSK